MQTSCSTLPSVARAILCAAATCLVLVPALAQPSFTEVSPTGATLFETPAEEDFWVTAVAPADFDGDGDLDLAVLGFYVVYNVSAVDRLVLFRNQGPGETGRWSFEEVDVAIGTLTAGSSDLAWGDYDGDGDPDLAIASDGVTTLYRNDAGTLVATGLELPGYWEDSEYTGAYDLRSLTWADADNDGDLDLLVPSVFDFGVFEYATKLLRNDGPGGDGWAFVDAAAALDPTVHAQSAWADDDGDGDLDLFLVNVDPYTETGFIRRFGNDPGGFVAADLLGIRVEYGLADWGDYDADGDLDILVAGNIHEVDDTYTTVLRVYRNDGDGYTETTLANGFSELAWLDIHAATWADYDSDGDVDVLVTGSMFGEGEIIGRSEIWGNDGGTFTSLGVELPAPISSIGRGGSFTWLDIDDDGDLDYLVAGAYYVPGGNGLVAAEMHLYRNDATGSNAAPSAPANVAAVPFTGGVLFAWSAATDDHTEGTALTYDLEIRPTGGSGPASHRLPEPGNISAATSWQLLGLRNGAYDWSVRAVDSAFNGGTKVGGTFVIGGGAVGPPGVPDGSTGAGLTVGKASPDGKVLSVFWDTASCDGAVDHHLVFGTRAQLPTAPGGVFATNGARCDLGHTSPYTWTTLSGPPGTAGFTWFLVIANDGLVVEGSWGSGAGGERQGPGTGGASNRCGMVLKDLSNECGQ